MPMAGCRKTRGKYIIIGNEAISSYGTIAFLEVGFSGENLMLDGEIIGNAIFYFDGDETTPNITENGLYFLEKSTKHLLKFKVYGDGHFISDLL